MFINYGNHKLSLVEPFLDKLIYSKIKMIYLLNIFKSKYCLSVFALSFVLSYFLIPKTVFYGWYTAIAILFMISFSLVTTCIVRNVKEKVMLAKTYKSSIIGIVAVALGLGALQVCGVGAPVCGAAVGLGIFSSIFPTVFVNLMSRYSIHFIILSIVFQLVALYFMNCCKNLKLKK